MALFIHSSIRLTSPFLPEKETSLDPLRAGQDLVVLVPLADGLVAELKVAEAADEAGHSVEAVEAEVAFDLFVRPEGLGEAAQVQLGRHLDVLGVAGREPGGDANSIFCSLKKKDIEILRIKPLILPFLNQKS